MPCHLIAPLTRQVIGCNTGPYGGLCQLDPELDHPTHDRGKSCDLEVSHMTHDMGVSHVTLLTRDVG